MHRVMNKEEIIRGIRAEVARQELSNYELAKRAGLYRSHLQRFDTPDWGQQIETLCKIADALGLEIVVKKKK